MLNYLDNEMERDKVEAIIRKNLNELLKKYNLDLESVSKIVRYRNEGMSFTEIGQRLGLTRQRVSEIIQELRLISKANPVDFRKIIIGLVIVGLGFYALEALLRREEGKGELK